MQQLPESSELLAAVVDALRDEVIPHLEGRSAFVARVATNAIEIVLREIEQTPAADAAAHSQLQALLGREDSLAALNEELCDRIAGGEFTLSGTPGLADHLWDTTLRRIAIDQPRYSGYLRNRHRQD